MLRRLIAVALLVCMSGCSAYMAANADSKRDLDLLGPGTPRDTVLAELGTPLASSTDAGGSFDLYRFTRNRSTASNTGRAVLYGAAAFMSLGLSEVVTTPLEGVVGDAGTMSLKTYFDENNRLTRALVQDGSDWITLNEYRRRAEIQPAQNEGAR